MKLPKMLGKVAVDIGFSPVPVATVNHSHIPIEYVN